AAAWVLAGAQWARLDEPTAALGLVGRLRAVTLDQGLWLPLGWYGFIRRGEPASRALAAAGLALLLLPLPALVRVEPWGPHALYRLGLIMAAAAPTVELCAAAGAAIKEGLPRLAATQDARIGAAAMLLALAPGSFPVWWQPVQLDPVFADSLVPVGEVTLQAAAAVRTHTAPQAVVVAGHEYGPAVAVLACRRLLRAPALVPTADGDARWRAEERTLAGRPGAPAARPFGVTHVLMAVGDFQEHGLEAPEQLAARPRFRLVWQHAEGIRLYEVSE
ncbi:MAG TPA: hypothetical protein VFO85_05505, partial [Vicinamibacteria bacterium]|nr:hypothetical protein [Vicinamibacteria bacterium]